MTEKKCELYLDHTPAWAGDGFFCSTCMIPFGTQIAETREALEDMVRQFAYTGIKHGGPVYHTGGLSALERAFDILGWEDPRPCPENKCQIRGCKALATCGRPTEEGDNTAEKRYIRCCGDHFSKRKP